MERWEPGNKHKINPAAARREQLGKEVLNYPKYVWCNSTVSDSIWGAWAIFWTGVSVWRSKVCGSGQWLSASKNSHELCSVPTWSHRHQWAMCWFWIDSYSDINHLSEESEMGCQLLGGFCLWVVVVDLKITAGRRKPMDSGWGVEVVLGGGCRVWCPDVLTFKQALIPAGVGWEGGSVHGVATYHSLSRSFLPLQKETLTWKVPCQ